MLVTINIQPGIAPFLRCAKCFMQTVLLMGYNLMDTGKGKET